MDLKFIEIDLKDYKSYFSLTSQQYSFYSLFILFCEIKANEIINIYLFIKLVAAGLTDTLVCDGNSMFDASVKGFENASDIANNFSQEGQPLSPVKKKIRPPRTCSLCGLQVTGQRSSLVYHANSK